MRKFFRQAVLECYGGGHRQRERRLSLTYRSVDQSPGEDFKTPAARRAAAVTRRTLSRGEIPTTMSDILFKVG
jgi:hypothetical protein